MTGFSSAESPGAPSGLLSVGDDPRPCEFHRAYLDLASSPGAPEATSRCSPESPEPRDFPAPPVGTRPYVLCNGHLRDLYDALDRVRQTAAPH